MVLRTIDARDAAKLIGIVVGLGFVAIGGRRALVQAQTEAPGVLAGVRLSLGSLVASCVASGLNALVYYSQTECRSGALPLPQLCELTRVSLVALGVGALAYLVGLVVWLPWRPPLALQMIRAILGVALLLAGYSFFLPGIS